MGLARSGGKMKIIKKEGVIPFTLRIDIVVPNDVREAVASAPYEEPSYASERRRSVWLVGEPDMKYGAQPSFKPAWRNEALEQFMHERGYDIAQLGLTFHQNGGGIMPHRDTTYALPGLSMGINLFGEATFYMWIGDVKASKENAALIVTLEDGDVTEFHNKWQHAGWSVNPKRVTINFWKVRPNWKPALLKIL